MFENVEQYKVAVISTAHLTEKDAKILERIPCDTGQGGANWIHNTCYGFIIRFTSVAVEELQNELKAFNISDEAIANMVQLYEAGFGAVHYDADALKLDGLKSWEW